LFHQAKQELLSLGCVTKRVHGEFGITPRLASGTDRGNGAAKRSDQGRHARAVVCQIVLPEAVLDRGFGRPQQSIRHGGEEDAAPIRLESLSDYQLEMLIQRLRKG
jgi:hypothetical protein